MSSTDFMKIVNARTRGGIRIEAIQVTRENIRNLAAWCGGRTAPAEGVYLQIGERQQGTVEKALYGMWILKLAPYHFTVVSNDEYNRVYVEVPSLPEK